MTDAWELPELVRAATELLEAVARNPYVLGSLPEDERVRLLRAVAEVACPDPEERRQQRRARLRRERSSKIQRDEDVLAGTGIRRLRSEPVFTTPNVFAPEGFVQDDADDAELGSCGSRSTATSARRSATVVHHFYDQLCPPCAEFNYAKRTETADLSGRVALLTGGRVKIGYQAGIKLLRAGAELIVTTRFPRDSALRYAREPDFDDWGDRLKIFGLDLRHTPSVEAFCRHLDETRPRLDFIVNNACQTVRRPPDFYRHMMELETASLGQMPEPVRSLVGEYEGLRGYHMLPEGPGALVAGPGHRRRSSPGSPTPPSCPRRRSCPMRPSPGTTCSPRAGSTRTCSRSTCGAGTRGASRWPRCRRSSCSRPSWSTPWPRSCSTPGSSR